MVSGPSGPIRSESQRRQYSRSSAHPCLSRWSLGRRLSCLARYTSAATRGEFSWRCRSSLRSPVQTDSARWYCTTSGGISALCWSRPCFRSCSASRESCLSGLDCGEPLPSFLVVCCVRAVPATSGTSRRAALFRLPSWSPWWGVSLCWCSNLALPRCSPLPTPLAQCPSRVPAWFGVVFRPSDGAVKDSPSWFPTTACCPPLGQNGSGPVWALTVALPSLRRGWHAAPRSLLAPSVG